MANRITVLLVGSKILVSTAEQKKYHRNLNPNGLRPNMIVKPG